MWWCLYHIFGANICSNFWTLTLLFWILQLIRFEQNEMWRMLVMAKFEYVKCNEFQLHSFWHDPKVIVISQKLEQTPGLCPVKLNFYHPNLVYHKHIKCFRLWTPLGFLHGTFYSQSHDLSWHWFCIFSLQFWQCFSCALPLLHKHFNYYRKITSLWKKHPFVQQCNLKASNGS